MFWLIGVCTVLLGNRKFSASFGTNRINVKEVGTDMLYRELSFYIDYEGDAKKGSLNMSKKKKRKAVRL